MRAVLFVVATATSAHADATVEVTLNQEGAQLAADLGISVPELAQEAEDRVDELYRVQRIDELLRAFADTAAFAQRGLGADYDVDPGDILIGAAIGAVHGDVAIGTKNELLGGSVMNVALLAGVNLKQRWTLFANGFYEKTTIHGLEGHLLTLGAHAQYQVLPARDAWTGLAATSGLEYARWSVGNVSEIESHFDERGTTVHMSSTGTLTVLTTTVSVPLEISTGVRLARVISFYIATGLDLTAGTSEITAQLDSVLMIGAERRVIGHALITGRGENSPSPVSVHALGGIGLHLRHARVFVQGVIAPGDVGAMAGVRMAL